MTRIIAYALNEGKIQNTKHYDLEKRTLEFARRAIELSNDIPETLATIELIKQLINSSSSRGANYIEAKLVFK